MNNHKKRLLIDFDGVIHKYSLGWYDGTIYDEPIEGAFDKLQLLRASGFEIVIFSTRCNTKRGIEEVSAWFDKYRKLQRGRNWREFDFIDILSFTDRKVPALAYIDDRGIRFDNWNNVVKYFI